MKRLFLLLVVALALTPGTWWRSPHAGEVMDTRQILTMDRLNISEVGLGEMEIEGVWHLRSPNSLFSGYSALAPMGDGTLLALSDSGRMMRFSPPGVPDRGVSFDYFAARATTDKHNADVEAVTRDPVTGRLWAAFEGTARIARYNPDFAPSGRIRPTQMRDWPKNSGPESIVRLGDGRFIVLSEGTPEWFSDDLPALLYPSDPLEGAEPVEFKFLPPDGFVPVDTALLPDGRVLILLRSVLWRLPPRFESMLMIADPDDIVPGERWNARVLAHLAEPLPTDNFEGLAVEPGEDGRLTLWLISDDNSAQFQRTLLMKLKWQPDDRAQEKARGTSHAPH